MPIKTQLDEPPAVNLTPMIDVVFLLIIFFMVAAKFTELERKLGLRVPSVATSTPLAPAPRKRVINVYQDGRITIDRESVTLEQLINRLGKARSQYRGLGVLIRGDAGVRYQRVADVLAACRQAGVAELGIAVKMAQQRQVGREGSLR
jgi:biopolymer transport protein ExbD